MTLHKAILGLYAAFASYATAHVDGCPCCLSTAEQAMLAATPLRELDGQVLGALARSVLTTWGDDAALKRFLPRAFELYANNALDCDPEVLFGKLRAVGWQAWPAPEREPVRAMLHALWEDTLASFPASRDLDGLLCAIGCATDDIAPFLHAWALPEPPRLRNLAAFVADVYPLTYHRRGDAGLSNPFWEPEPERAVIAWLISSELARAMALALVARQDQPDVAELAACAEQLSWLRAAS